MSQPRKKTPTPRKQATLDGLHIDITNLHDLLDALADHMIGMDHTRDGELDNDMQRATALASIARDVASRLVDDVEGLV